MSMEPQKAKRAIIITAVIAVLLLAVCVLLLLEPWNAKKTSPDPSPAVVTAVIVGDTPTPTQKDKGPGSHDLVGASDQLQYPKEDSYLDSYQSMTIHVANANYTSLTYRPEKWQHTVDGIMRIDNGTVVTALAQENGFTLVKVQDGVVGWVETQNLEAH